MNLSRTLAVFVGCTAPVVPVSAKVAAPVSRRAALLRAVTSPRALTMLAVAGLSAAVGLHPHAVLAAGTDTGVPDTTNLDTGAFNGVVSGTGSYLNLLIKNFGVPAIIVSLAVSGWAFVRHMAKGAFH